MLGAVLFSVVQARVRQAPAWRTNSHVTRTRTYFLIARMAHSLSRCWWISFENPSPWRLFTLWHKTISRSLWSDQRFLTQGGRGRKWAVSRTFDWPFFFSCCASFLFWGGGDFFYPQIFYPLMNMTSQSQISRPERSLIQTVISQLSRAVSVSTTVLSAIARKQHRSQPHPLTPTHPSAAVRFTSETASCMHDASDPTLIISLMGNKAGSVLVFPVQQDKNGYAPY